MSADNTEATLSDAERCERCQRTHNNFGQRFCYGHYCGKYPEEYLKRVESALRLIRNGADGALRGTAEWNMSNVYRVADAALKSE